MLTALLSRFGGWIVAGLAGLAAVAGIYFKGRAAGRQVERVERDEKINEQAATARNEVRDVEQKNAGRSDDAVLDAAGKWVRK